MSNFGFIEPIWPEVFADCVRAEGYLKSDPRSACIYGRRVAELLVDYLYDVLELAPPYRDDLNARINDAAFAAKVGVGIQGKLNLVRRLGNTAAHSIAPVRGGDAPAAWNACQRACTSGLVPTAFSAASRSAEGRDSASAAPCSAHSTAITQVRRKILFLSISVPVLLRLYGPDECPDRH